MRRLMGALAHQRFGILRSALLASVLALAAHPAEAQGESVAAPTPAEDDPAAATEPDPAAGPMDAATDETSTARAVFAQGLALIDQEKWEAAADCFRRVLAILWSPAAAHNLGSALVEMGRLVEASEQLRLAARDEQADPSMRAAAKQLLDATELKIGKLKIRVVDQADDIEVLLDGRALPSAALEGTVRIDPGPHVVVVLRAGTYVSRQQIFLGDSGPRLLEVAIDATPPPPEFQPPPATLLVPDPMTIALPPPVAEAPPPATTSTTAPPPRAQARDAAAPWWLWVGGGAVVTGLVAATLAVVFARETSTPAPIAGDLGPGVLRGQVGAP